MNTQMKVNTLKLNVYIVNKEWKLQRVVNTSCKLHRSTSIPMIEICDSMIRKLIKRETIYFYDPRDGRINFFCADLLGLCNTDREITDNITIELLEVGDEYVLLSPGFWVGNNLDERRRLYDDGNLYEMISMLSAEARLGTDFNYELAALLTRNANINNNIEETAGNADSEVVIIESENINE